ncbi:MAG: NAD-dependent epimerase/dehydratase family protein [Oscillospiraceae bacterium]|nr:NAD-dependent epimerase/dehydratase family protein [Oscillospiraceae bacterium]
MTINNKIYQNDVKTCAGIKLPWEKLNGKHILISGASGMVGSFAVDVLMARNALYNAGISVTAIGRNATAAAKKFAAYRHNEKFNFVRHDITLPFSDIKGKKHTNFIIHGASNTHPVAYASDPIGTISTNVLGTYNLLDYAVKSGGSIRFAFLSTVEIYGENDSEKERFAETDLGFIDCNTVRAGYSESKRLGEALCNAYTAKHNQTTNGLDIVIPRLCRIYGPTMLDSDSKASSQFIKRAVRGQDVVLKSKGDQFYSYIYVADAVSAIFTILLCGESGGAYNVADKNSDVTLKEFAKIAAISGDVKIIHEPPGETEAAGFSKATKALLDPAKLKNLGWQPENDINSGIKKTIQILKNVSENFI